MSDIVYMMWIIFSFFAVLVFLLFPVFIRINIFADIAKRKIYYSVYFLRVLKLYGGYMTFGKTGAAFHLSDKNAVLLPYRDMVDTRKKFEITKGFLVLKYRQVAEIGIEENAALAVLAATLADVATGIFVGYLVNERNCTNCSGDVILHQGKNCCKISVSTTIMFNFAILLLAGIKIVLRKIAEVAYEQREKSK